MTPIPRPATRASRRVLLPLALPLLVLAGAVAGAAACDGRREAAAAPAPAAVRDTATLNADAVRLAGLSTARADSVPWRESWSVPARLTLDPAQTHRLGAIAEGRVARVLVGLGDRVRAGQVLVAVHSHELLDARSALAKAAAADAEAVAALGLAESTAARAERLYAIRALSLADLERARAAAAQSRGSRAQAAAELARARAMREHLVGGGPVPAGTDEHEVLVRSPIDGVVVGRDAQPGTVVLVGAPLVTVSRTTALVLQAQVPERALGAVAPGGDVAFTVAAFPAARFAARVTRVSPVLDTATRTIEVQARVTAGADRLRAEMYATAELTGPPGAPALAVPAAAIQSLEGDTVVVVARPRGASLEVEAVPVRVGRRSAERAEIVSGLAPGTPVVAQGAAVARAEILRRRQGT